MEFVATTITEHIRHESELRGKIKGKIETLENLCLYGILPKKQFEKMVAPLRRELSEILAGEKQKNLRAEA